MNDTVQTVSEFSDEYTLVQSDYEVKDILESVLPPHAAKQAFNTYLYLFVLVGDAEYLEVWGLHRTPYLTDRAYMLYDAANSSPRMPGDAEPANLPRPAFGQPAPTRVNELVSWERLQGTNPRQRDTTKDVWFGTAEEVDMTNEYRHTGLDTWYSWEEVQQIIDKREQEAHTFGSEFARTADECLVTHEGRYIHTIVIRGTLGA